MVADIGLKDFLACHLSRPHSLTSLSSVQQSTRLAVLTIGWPSPYDLSSGSIMNSDSCQSTALAEMPGSSFSHERYACLRMGMSDYQTHESSHGQSHRLITVSRQNQLAYSGYAIISRHEQERYLANVVQHSSSQKSASRIHNWACS